MFITLGQLRQIIIEGLGWSSYTRNGFEASVDLEPMLSMSTKANIDDELETSHLFDELDDDDQGPVPRKNKTDAYRLVPDPYVNDETVLPTKSINRG